MYVWVYGLTQEMQKHNFEAERENSVKLNVSLFGELSHNLRAFGLTSKIFFLRKLWFHHLITQKFLMLQVSKQRFVEKL